MAFLHPFCRFLLFVFAVTGQATLPPVVFLPGYSGSILYVTVNSSQFVPDECAGVISVGEKFRVLGNVSMLYEYPDCIHKLMMVNFNDETKEFYPLPGVSVYTDEFGSFRGIVPVYLPFARELESWGYVTNVNSFGAPYDYRYLSVSSLQRIGFIDQLVALVESAYISNNKSKVILIGHSNGGPSIYAFLAHMPRTWKDTHLAAIIPLSGNFLGTMNVVRSFVYGENPGMQNMMNTWEAQYASCAWGAYAGVTDVPIVITHNGTQEEKQYTAKLTDMVTLLKSANRSDWGERFEAVYPSMDRSTAPGVDCYCFYGSGLDTSFSFTFSGDILDEKFIDTGYMDGDANQDITDNTFCEMWRGEQHRQGYELVTKEFPGVRHMQMYSDPLVMEAIRDVVRRYEMDSR